MIHFNTLIRDGFSALVNRVNEETNFGETGEVDEVAGGLVVSLTDAEKQALSEAYGLHPSQIFDANVSHRFVHTSEL